MIERLTLATSTGLPLLSLAFHVAMGVIALVAGYIAIVAGKGGKWHRRAGLAFVCTMIATGITAGAISIYQGKPFGGGWLVAYLVFTAFTTLRPRTPLSRGVDIALLLVVSVATYGMFQDAMTALASPRKTLDGVPAAMLFFLATVFLLAAIGDLRMIRADGLQGSRRIARHFWRVCFGLFMASGSFVTQLVRMPFMPSELRSVPVIVFLGAAPLVVLLYWMWRVRLRQNFRGLMTTKPIEARATT